MQDQGYDTVDANLLLHRQPDERDYEPAARILADLGVRSIRLMTNNPDKMEAMERFGIHVLERVAVPPRTLSQHNLAYLATKAARMRHLLELPPIVPVNGGTGDGPALLHGAPPSPARFSVGDGDAAEPTTGTIFAGPVAHIANGLGSGAASGRTTPHDRPYVTLTYAQSLDGSIAARPGLPLRLSGPESMRMTHRLRATHAGILVGRGTVMADDPQLTVRLVEGSSPRPVVLDTGLRCPLDRRIIREAGRGTIIVCGREAEEAREHALRALGVDVLRVDLDECGRVCITAALRALREHGITSLMVEGGREVIRSFLRSRAIDQILVTVAPRLLGGPRAVECDEASVQEPLLPDLCNARWEVLGQDAVLHATPVWHDG